MFAAASLQQLPPKSLAVVGGIILLLMFLTDPRFPSRDHFNTDGGSGPTPGTTIPLPVQFAPAKPKKAGAPGEAAATPAPIGGVEKIVAMVHVHCTTALLNPQYSDGLGVPPVSPAEVNAINLIVQQMNNAEDRMAKRYPVLGQIGVLRSTALLLDQSEETHNAFATFRQLPFVKFLVLRALKEVSVYKKNGIKIVEIENVGAPYFIGRGKCPWEEILAIAAVAHAVRAAHPTMPFGMHILSSNELETLPLAILYNAFFVRSEASLFRGERPEGVTDNSGNLARFMYARNVLHGLRGTQSKTARRWPQLWSDMQKKHTVFPTELSNLDTWLGNILFMKLEGVILTGAETGSNVAEADLKKARAAIGKALKYAQAKLRADVTVPLVTGSGEDFAMYHRYADFIIVGTKLKEREYWENDVLDANVAKVVKSLQQAPLSDE